MVLKTVVLLSMYLLPILAVVLGLVTETWQLFTCFVIAGLGMAGVGMGVMHDANHGSYSKNPTINKWVGYTLNLVGASST